MTKFYTATFTGRKGQNLPEIVRDIEAESAHAARKLAETVYEEIGNSGYRKADVRLKQQGAAAEVPTDTVKPQVVALDAPKSSPVTVVEFPTFQPEPEPPRYTVESVNTLIDALEPGEQLRLEEVPAEVYHAVKGLGSTSIKRFEECPAKFKAHQEGAFDKCTDRLDLGSAVHSAVLEPHLFETEFKKQPPEIKVRNGKVWEALVAANPQTTFLKPKMYDEAIKMSENVLERYEKLFTGGHAEVSYWLRDEETGIILKSRLDYQIGDLAVDLKTSDSSKPHQFNRRASNFSYYLQDGLYTIVTGVSDFLFVTVETESPFLCSLNAYDQYDREYARYKVREILTELKECQESGYFGGWQDDPYEINQLTIPTWKK